MIYDIDENKYSGKRIKNSDKHTGIQIEQSERGGRNKDD